MNEASKQQAENEQPSANSDGVMQGRTALSLSVRNHPGVMSHICGLLSRRAYNVEGIICLPEAVNQAARSRVWLLLDEHDRLDQVISQLQKLIDVFDVSAQPADSSLFSDLMNESAVPHR